MALREIRSRASEAASEGRRRVRRTNRRIREAGERGRETADRARERKRQGEKVVDEARERASDAREKASEAKEGVAQAVRDTARDITDSDGARGAVTRTRNRLFPESDGTDDGDRSWNGGGLGMDLDMGAMEDSIGIGNLDGPLADGRINREEDTDLDNFEADVFDEERFPDADF